jgi:uncharacterized protein YndB with AHSA1/START domain
MRKNALLAAMILTLAPGWVKSEVVDASANGFTVKISFRVQANPAEVYANLIHHVGDWWNPEHTYSGSSHNLSIEAKPAGCFCEKLPNDGGVRHMEVVYLIPGKALSLTGAMGPLQSIAAGGNMQVQLAPADGGTKMDVTYAVFGYLPAGMNTWAEPVNAVLTEQFTRLKNYVEKGNPAPK